MNESRPEQTGALVSWAFYDWANSAFSTVVQTFVFAAYFTRQVAADEAVGSAQWGTAVSVAGLVVALTAPVLGAVADQGGRRKPWLAVFTLLCVSATALLWFVRPDPSSVPLALVLVVVGVIGIELAIVFYNAMLPTLAPPERVGRWSGWAWGLGYAGGLFCLVTALFVFVRGEGAWLGLDPGTAEPVRATFPLVAVWYALFSIPLFVVTPDTRGTGKTLVRAARDGLSQLVRSIREIRRHAGIARFLVARMIYIDGLGTLFAFGGVFAASVFGLSEEGILQFAIALNVSAGLGAAGFAWIDDRIGGKRTILVSLAGLILAAAATISVRSVVLFWVFAAILGIFVGPVQAASRSWLARMAPERLRGEMFGLYAFSGKATAFVGPFLVGQLTLWSGSPRVGMAAVLFFFAAGFALLLSVPADRRENRG